MKKLIYLISLLLLVFSCGDKSDPDAPKPEKPDIPKVSKSITRAETYYELKIHEISEWEDLGDSAAFIDYLDGSDSVQSHSQNIETNWDAGNGIITFNSENPGSSPYPTVTIIYADSSGRPHSNSEEFEFEYDAIQVGISLQDVLVGTAAELNARTYKHPYFKGSKAPVVYVKEIGENYIEGVLVGFVYKRIFDQGGFTGEVIQAIVRCEFRVCTRC